MDTNEAKVAHKPEINKQNISFKFTKTTSSKSLLGNKLDEASFKPKDYVKSVDESEIKSIAPEVKSQELVIPLIRKNNWRIPETSEHKDEETKLKELAIQELLKETADKKAEWDDRDSTMAIPLIMQNKLPDGFETEEKLDVSLRALESTLEDYEKVPVEQFGLAMLRGMGWKEGMAIGGRNKECVKPIEVKMRPKGLGLGADASVLKKSDKKAKEEKLELVKDAFVQVIQGPHKGHYGQVMGLDEETGRAMIKLSNDESVKSLPEFFFNLVSKKEFDKESRIINRDSYEKYKMKEEKKYKDDKQNAPEYKSNGREEKDAYEHESRKSKKHSKKRKHSRERSEEHESFSKTKQAKIWIRPQLRVRFIDEKYKKGRYFNKKLIVVDVLSPNRCSLKTEDDRTLLDDISPSMLETVVPRDESAYVMVVQGKYQGELCTILKRDKTNCVATVQFLSDRDRAVKIDYDSICEYVGDVAQYD